jgi:hypothetical protein
MICTALVIPEFFKEKYLEFSPFQFARWEIPDVFLSENSGMTKFCG